jgi:hypothetical protein
LPDVLAATTQNRAPRGSRVLASSRRALHGVAAVAVVSVLTSGCLLETKTAEGRALHDAPEVLARSQSVGLSMTVSSRLVKQGSLTTLPARDPGFKVEGVLDLKTGRAAYLASGRPVSVFDRDHAFALRPHARPTDARPWVKVTVDEDLNDQVLDPAALPPSLAVLALRPSVLVDSLAGALTGSIEKRGAEDVDGTPTTKYTARFDLVQALSVAKRREYSQREQDDLVKLFEVLGMEGDAIHDGAVWLDDQGAPRRLALALREEPTPESLILLNVDLKLVPRSEPATIDVPGGNSVTTVPSLFQFLQPLKQGASA